MTNIIPVTVLQDNKLIVWSKNNANKLYYNGFYGKPLGLPRPKEDFNAPLILDPVEGAYLLKKNIIEIKTDTGMISHKDYIKSAGKTLKEFNEKLLVYTDLREKGYIVTPGIKYGCDFAVYEKGPGIDHAPYIVQIMKDNDEISSSEIVKSGRLATTVRKSFIIAVISEKEITYLDFNWWKA